MSTSPKCPVGRTAANNGDSAELHQSSGRQWTCQYGNRIQHPSTTFALVSSCAVRQSDGCDSWYRILGMTEVAVFVPLRLFRTLCTRSSQPEEFGESTIGKRRYKPAPECAYLLSPLCASPWNRNVSIEATAAICQQMTGAKEPVKAAKRSAGKVLASTAGAAPDPSLFWLNGGRAMPKSPCSGSSS
jgi:hypothetical protein